MPPSTFSTAGVTPEQQSVTKGLLKAVYDELATQPPQDSEGWSALAETLLDRIAADDRAYFAGRAEGFEAAYATAAGPSRVEGRVLVFDRAPGAIPQANYWAMEAAIERQGRAPTRGLEFNVPYAIAAWPENGSVEMLAINHWREESAVPIRFLYPADEGPAPAGDESTLHVRLPRELAPRVTQKLVAACNQQGGG
jgi:hypothetical protein